MQAPQATPPLGTPTFAQLVDASFDAAIIIDAACRVRYANRAMSRLTGYGSAELVGESLIGLLAVDEAREHDTWVRSHAEGLSPSRNLGKVRQMQLRHRTGELIPVELKALDLGADAGERLFGAFITDMRTEQRPEDLPSERRCGTVSTASSHGPHQAPDNMSREEWRRLQTLGIEQGVIMEMIARDAPLAEVLKAVVRMLESWDARFMCSILLAEDGKLRRGAAPSLADSYNLAIDGIEIAPGNACCGTAAFDRKCVITHDIGTDPLWDRHRHAALAHGLQACWSIPILSSQGEVLGTFATYSLTPYTPTATELEVQQGCCHIASVAIGRHIARHERRRAEQEIHLLAFYDQLTGLANRRLLHDRLHHALAGVGRNNQYGAVVMVDLDHFKTVNDTLGHAAGDMLLRQTAARLRSCVREGDTVARLGGDEFVVVLEQLAADPGEAGQRAALVADKLAELLGRTFDLDGCEHVGTASFGVTLFGGEARAAEVLLKEADLALYRAKAEGRSTIRFFDRRMQMDVARRAELQADLRQALRDEALELYYQPQVDAQGCTRGVEALARWQHPQKGMISPGEFIGLAEETGLIFELGHLVLKKACRALAVWEDVPSMRALTVAVNVSTLQLRRADFVPFLMSTVADTGADPRKLKIEITESVFADRMEDTIEKMRALKAVGVAFSIDDFGTGYSSLSYLKRLPLDQLKIDQSFVRDLLLDPNDEVIARTIIGLGATLRLEVIAEGVETDAQRAVLHKNGCLAYQGYLFGRPMPEVDLRSHLAVQEQAGLAPS